MTLKADVAKLLQDEDVKLWQDDLNSASVKRIYAEALCRFCQHLNMTPKKMIAFFRAGQTEGEKKLQAFIQISRANYAPKTVNNLACGVRSYLRHNGISVQRKINVGNTRLTPTIENEAPPGQDGLRRILDHGDVRGRVAVSLIGLAGLRPETAAGLRLGDLPELKIVGDTPLFSKTPTLIRVKSQLSKNKRSYITFLIEEGCHYLLEYLQLRQRNGEILTPNSQIIRESGKGGKKTFGRKGFSKLIKRIFEKAGVNSRPYVLRSYFDTAIMNARNVPYDYQHFWMGHAGTIEATYTVNKQLPDWQVEEMRKTFHEAVEPRLATFTSEGSSKEKTKIEIKEAMLISVGYSEEDVAKWNIAELGAEDLQRLLRDKLFGRKRLTTKKLQNGGERVRHIQKVVSVDEVDSYLEDGWKFVSALNLEKAIVSSRRAAPTT